jgi:peptidoglycan/xylan/chitin deacetylase (PgdA/CDA1 family)
MRSRVRGPWIIALLVLVAVVAGLLVAVTLAADGDGKDSAVPTTGSTGSTSSTVDSTTSSTTTTSSAPTTSEPPGTVPTTRPSGSPAVAIRVGDTSRPLVALTFDCGSDAGWTVEILDTLAANGVRATFGVTGTWANDHADLVARIVGAGHQVVNHGYDHTSFTGRSTGAPPLSRAERLDQLARADAAIQDAGGASTVPWFRPPYGDEDESVRIDVGLAGYRYELLWTVDSLGWRGTPTDDVVRRVLDGARPGAIILFHVGSASTDHAALQPIIDGLRQRGLGFTTAAGIVGA